ncbi:Dbl homology domain-containing protein [Halteromyces radiatus]|uniref:Dbl homology domain-containing protein n=1 Tax=Halteromyces radiatus TaxID=101107 RepID=UPI00222070EA|nr:Dbl homology domain-containing protein [Halteromyces radiatus]KAI8099002.1 Dbl homology domain-containing protein [Halteromyces radiatus]
MAHDITARLEYLGIVDKLKEEEQTLPTPDNEQQMDFPESVMMEEKELRRISLPADAYKRSKFTSWIQYNLPTPPSSRTNSNSSSHRRSVKSISSIKSTSSDPSSPISSSPISSSPTSSSPTNSEPSSVHISYETSPPHHPTPPPRSSSLQINPTTTTTTTTGSRLLPQRSTSSSSRHKKKKRLLPLVSRIRLCPTERARLATSIEPPEPPPQLLLSAIHCEEQEYTKRKSASQNDIEQQHDGDMTTSSASSSIVTPTTPTSTQTFCWYDTQNPLSLSAFSGDTSNHSPLRRRSSCPSKPTKDINTPECAMMRSFVSSAKSSSPLPMSPTSSLPVDNDVFDNNQQCVLSFSAMKPRTRPLKRRTSGKRERKALQVWHDSLVESLKNEQNDTSSSLKASNRSASAQSLGQQLSLSNEKRERNALTRKFILREFYLTEVTFWNQLYYSKVMFADALQRALDVRSPFTRLSDMDLFANLPDLMQCSSHLIRSMSSFLEYPSRAEQPTDNYVPPSPSTSISSGSTLPIHLNSDTRLLPSPNDQLMLGKEICAMAHHFVAFLRCAVDYKMNRKQLDQKEHNKGFASYQEKLAARKETNQFHVHDYLIIPIQRITRYGLLLSDLQKHTEQSHPDYHHITRARMILTSLAVAMNKAQH